MVRAPGVIVLILCLANGYLAMAWQVAAPAIHIPGNEAKQAIEILNRHCLQCHGPSKQQGKLRLDQPSLALAKVIGNSKPDASILLDRISSHDEERRMPPQGARLSSEEVATLRRWISQGAAWPAAVSPKQHWSFQPIRRPSLPEVKDQSWVRSPIDTFVLHRLEELSIKPSPEADATTLIRRLSLDLCGTLPTPEAVDAFVANTTASAYEAWVDRLLASPQFGERWGRHWLDLARYGDSDGLEHDEPRPHGYLFRDWVIDAYNSDMPFDQFTIEQIAGDLLPEPSKDQYIASGFHRQTQTHNTAEMIKEEFRIKKIKDRVNTTGMTWLGMTVGCAECHDHKYDPLSQHEYYQLYAYFNDAEEVSAPRVSVPTFRYSERPTHLQVRGNPKTLGREVQPDTPAVFPPVLKTKSRGTRLDLARWLVQKDHPLTARVEVNRLWQHLFGQGLVLTPDDFGIHGTPPRHGHLLDWLAAELQVNGWSRKKLIKTIVCSATYRQSARHRRELAGSDPMNTLVARQNRFRVEAEIIHDISLQVAGLLNTGCTGGASFQQLLPRGLDIPLIKNNKLLDPSDWDDRHRRGIYIQVQRTYQHPLLKTFDAPDGNQACACRDRQATPAQALSLLNDPLFREAAYELGKRLKSYEGTNDEKLRWGYRLCLGRIPEAGELKVLQRLFEQQQVSQPDLPWVGVATVLLNMEAFTTRE